MVGGLAAEENGSEGKDLQLAVQEECSPLIDWDKLIDEMWFLIFENVSLSPMRREVLNSHISKEEFAALVQENLKEQNSYLTTVRYLTYALAGTALVTGIIFGSTIKKMLGN